MAHSAAPFLMFEGDAEKAMNLYTAVFRRSEGARIERYGPGEPGVEGSVKRADFTIGGHRLICIDSYVKHGFSFTPSVSIFVECEDDAELDRAFGELSAGGQVLMPLDNYGFSTRFGWINDRFGVSWQLNLE